MIQNSDPVQMCDKFWCDVTALRCHQKQHHVTGTFEGIQVNMQYQVRVPISSDICMLVPRISLHGFNHSIFIAI